MNITFAKIAVPAQGAVVFGIPEGTKSGVKLPPAAAKFDKQMKYANKRGIGFVVLPGDEERHKAMVSLKNFTTGEQKMLSVAECIDAIRASN